MHIDEMEEFGLTKEQVLEARRGDALPAKPVPDHRVISTPAADEGAAHLTVHVLGSGSKGNCVVISGRQGAVMVDCGFSRKEAYRRLELAGIERGSVKAILLTHEHSDHASGIGVVARGLTVPVIATAGTLHARADLERIEDARIIAAGETIHVAGIRIDTFPTSHDVADPIGARFSYTDDSGHEDTAGLVTDTGVLTDGARDLLEGVRILALETNHDPDMLRYGPYPAMLKARISGTSGHLSNDQGADALQALLHDGLACVIGMHLSQINNTPDKALRALMDVKRRTGLSFETVVSDQSHTLSVL